jgi:sortase A
MTIFPLRQPDLDLRRAIAAASPGASDPAAAAPLSAGDGRGEGRGGGPFALWSVLGVACLIAGLTLAMAALLIPAKAQLAQFLMARAWSRELATGQPARPWPWADFTPVAKLGFPAQHRSVLALTDASGESLAFGPTLLAASAKPGARGVTVFAAHRDTHFAFLARLKPGDAVEVETRDGAVTYRITGAEVVRWNASGIHPHDNGQARLALVTCWPLDANFHGSLRYIVWGERSDS